ncbi:MAG: orotidine-5'-phosphate decarboxylase, partial [Thermoanaerobaculia bacterium]|nr:orotidine-5'-phosphate decarboxylase [Thermoanaerobaculia bacterium]
MKHFADEVIRRVRDLGHPLCAGLDPHDHLLPDLFSPKSRTLADRASAIESMLLAFVERLAGKVAVVKPQIGFFEPLGWRGIRVLEHVVARCRELELLVLLDAKRGDIGSTAEGYASAYLDESSPVAADAITLNPYLGLDSLQPFLQRAARGAGLFVLVRTSNPGGSDFQDVRVVKLQEDSQQTPAEPLHHRVAHRLREVADESEGAEGWSNVGVVVGATRPDEAEEVRGILPTSLFLVPGYGTQGGSAVGAVHGFVPGPSGLEGGLVNSSRGLLFPPRAATSDRKTWERAVDDA